MLLQTIKNYLKRFLWSIDRINGIGHIKRRKINCIPEVKKNLIISGWIVDSKAFATISSLCIEINGKNYLSLSGLIRTDVSFAFKNIKCGTCGFLCVIPKEEFQVGEIYTIKLRIETKECKKKGVNTSVRFKISNDEFNGENIITTEDQEYSQYISDTLSFKYISGTGIEIGALHAPMSFDKEKAQVLYVDRLSRQELYLQYPEFRKFDIVNADIIDNGADLSTITDSSFDFCISNHVLEHIENPLKALMNWLRVIKPGGLLYLSVPLPNNEHDKNRQATSISHIIKDYDLLLTDSKVFEKQRYEHFREFVKSAIRSEQTNDHCVEDKINELIAINYSIHFHVFTEETLLQMIDFVSNMMSIKIVEFVKSEPEEFILIIRKLDRGA
ncbi:MAG: class I SAM-dependent methyltransferase [Proteobacteria bacterium]|nr:class I SAM-dependent methyltransferase [Pseudomonadota bacterium]